MKIILTVIIAGFVLALVARAHEDEDINDLDEEMIE